MRVPIHGSDAARAIESGAGHQRRPRTAATRVPARPHFRSVEQGVRIPSSLQPPAVRGQCRGARLADRPLFLAQASKPGSEESRATLRERVAPSRPLRQSGNTGLLGSGRLFPPSGVSIAKARLPSTFPSVPAFCLSKTQLGKTGSRF
jgi:hypothetical protein